MGRDSKCDLGGILPASEIGVNSPHPVAVTYHLLREHDLTAYLVPTPKRTGSVDDLLAAHALFSDSELEYRIACERGSIWAISFPRERDYLHMLRDCGDLPRTWQTHCASCKGTVWWFAAPPDGPDLQTNVKLHATSAKLLASAAVPGTHSRVDRFTLADGTRPRHQWVEHCEPWSVPLAPLPERWIRGLPHKDGLRITATATPRSEWGHNPSSSRYIGR